MCGCIHPWSTDSSCRVEGNFVTGSDIRAHSLSHSSAQGMSYANSCIAQIFYVAASTLISQVEASDMNPCPIARKSRSSSCQAHTIRVGGGQTFPLCF